MELKVVTTEISRLCLKPGQMLVVKVSQRLSMAQIAQIKKDIDQVVPTGVKAIVLDSGIDLMVVEPPNALS